MSVAGAARASLRSLPPAARLVAALLALACYAAFAHGATDGLAQATFVAGAAAIALAVACTTTFGGSLTIAAAPAARIGVGLLAAFALWTGLTLLWSAQPDRSWLAFNRTAAYVLVLCAALAACSTDRRAARWIATGWTAIATAVALYALGGKLAPGLHVPLLLDLDHTADVGRLRAPLEYWNALALVCAMAVPLALRDAADPARGRGGRLLAGCALNLLLLTVALAISRGGVLAVAVGAAVMILLGATRLRMLALLAATIATLTVPVAYAFSAAALTGNAVPLADRSAAGRTLLVLVLIGLALQVAAGMAMMRAERDWTATRSRRLWRALALAGAVGVLLGAATAAAQPGGVRGVVERAGEGFREPKVDRVFDPVRLVSSNSGNRWIWWREALAAWSDKPAQGWGAGSFAVVHRRYRTNELAVAQPHSVPLQWLAETGIVGFLLAAGGLAALGAAALARLRSLPRWRVTPNSSDRSPSRLSPSAPDPERQTLAALAALAAAWIVHGAVDWDWDVPGVTVPAMLALGALAALPPAARSPAPRMLGLSPAQESAGAGARGIVVAVATLVCATLALSAAVPAIAERIAGNAAALAGRGDDPRASERAAARAELAARIDPLSPRPLLVAASIAEGRGRLAEARELLLRATKRQPENPDPWGRLATLALQLVDRDGFAAATRRLLELDPASGPARSLAGRATAFLAPPSASATATGTPLPPR